MEHVSSVHPIGKFPEKVETLKRWARFPGWNFRTECRVPFTFLVLISRLISDIHFYRLTTPGNIHVSVNINPLETRCKLHHSSCFSFFSFSPHVRKSGFRNPRHFCLLNWLRNVESWALESGIQLKESGIPLTIGILNPSSTRPSLFFLHPWALIS